jgi:NTE family protein
MSRKHQLAPVPAIQQKKETKGADAAEKAASRKAKSPSVKKISLALQGGGAHGAFTWGILDRLLEDDRIIIDAISATSAGAVNAAVVASALLNDGDKEKARKQLALFWQRISVMASMLPFRPMGLDKWLGHSNLSFAPSFVALDFITRIFSPYQFNLLDINPLRSLLEEMVDFAALREASALKLFVNATHVRTGKVKVFRTEDLTLDMVMASACLPFIFKTVYVDGEPYWDGGYSGNPAIYPLIYHAEPSDVIVVQINPLYVEEVPTLAPDILDRVNEISFNSTLMREMRAISFVTKLIEEGVLNDPRYRKMHIHMMEAQDIMVGMGRASKLNMDADFLHHLKEIGRQTAEEWLEKHFEALGERSTIDIHQVYL